MTTSVTQLKPYWVKIERISSKKLYEDYLFCCNSQILLNQTWMSVGTVLVKTVEVALILKEVTDVTVPKDLLENTASKVFSLGI